MDLKISWRKIYITIRLYIFKLMIDKNENPIGGGV